MIDQPSLRLDGVANRVEKHFFSSKERCLASSAPLTRWSKSPQEMQSIPRFSNAITWPGTKSPAQVGTRNMSPVVELITTQPATVGFLERVLLGSPRHGKSPSCGSPQAFRSRAYSTAYNRRDPRQKDLSCREGRKPRHGQPHDDLPRAIGEFVRPRFGTDSFSIERISIHLPHHNPSVKIPRPPFYL